MDPNPPGKEPPKPPVPAEADEEVTVPDLSVFRKTGSGEMKELLLKIGLKPGFAMSRKDPPKGVEFNWFAGQSPGAGSKAKKGDVVTIFAFQPPGDPKDPPPIGDLTPPEDITPPGTMPRLIGRTLEQATARLTDKMSIGGIDSGEKPPTPEDALRIYAQDPPPGKAIGKDEAVVVTVKIYGSAKTDPEPMPEPQPEPPPVVADGGVNDSLVGEWSGTMKFSDVKTDTLNVSISKEGDTYVIGGVGATLKGRIEGGKLVGNMLAWDGLVDMKWTFTADAANADSLNAKLDVTAIKSGEKVSYSTTMQRKK
jgi:hypothetical protein